MSGSKRLYVPFNCCHCLKDDHVIPLIKLLIDNNLVLGVSSKAKKRGSLSLDSTGSHPMSQGQEGVNPGPAKLTASSKCRSEI